MRELDPRRAAEPERAGCTGERRPGLAEVRAAGVVLCGGRSSRMGRAKAWLPWNGRPLVVHVTQRLRAAVEEVVVVSAPDLELPPLDARVVRDREPGLGPLAGIREGLAHVSADLAYVTGTDVPFLTPAFVTTLLSFGCAAAPEVDGFVQTLAAVYPRAALPHAEALLGAGRRRPLDLLESLGYRSVRAQELPGLESLRGLNTPEAYLAAVREAFADPTVRLEFAGGVQRRAGRKALEVPVGSLREVLGHAPSALELCQGDRVAAPFRVSLDGRDTVWDARIPIGPGERVVVRDA